MDRQERNKLIVSLRDQGETLASIGKRVGLSRQRVREIIEREKRHAAYLERQREKEERWRDREIPDKTFLDELPLPPGVGYVLNQAGMKTAGQVRAKSDIELLRLFFRLEDVATIRRLLGYK